MRTTTLNGNFRLGVTPLLGISADGVDPYAKRAIAALAAEYDKIEWFDEDQWIKNSAALARSLDRKDWLELFVLDVLKDPAKAATQTGGTKPIRLDELLARERQAGTRLKVRDRIRSERLSVNVTAVLKEEALFEFLFAKAFYEYGLTDEVAIAEWMTDVSDSGGVGGLETEITARAADDFVNEKKIEVGKTFSADVRPGIQVSEPDYGVGAFEAFLDKLVSEYAFLRKPKDEIKKALAALQILASDNEKDYLLRYFDAAKITLNAVNAKSLIPAVLTQLRSSAVGSQVSASTGPGLLDFGVSYHTETFDKSSVNQDSVLCAAQMFYVMTLGDELGVLRAADLLVTKYLSSGRVDVRSEALLRDLQDYALNNEFRDLATGRVSQRTSEEERRMFYRQVFDYGDTEMLGQMVTNSDFTGLWTALMDEAVRYIEKAEKNDQPESSISRGPFLQVVEELQYNLSSYTTGMAKVIAPLAYRELDFVIQRLFRSKEVVDQLALHGSGSFWRVVERVLQEDSGQSVAVSAFQKKAQYGHQIISSIASYTPAMGADGGYFSGLVSTCEAFIIAAEQADSSGAAQRQPAGMPGNGSSPDSNGPTGATGQPDGWNF